MRTTPFSVASPQTFLVWVLVAFFGPLLHAQNIHIKVLNGRNGKPITNECLNIWLGPVHGAALLAPTNAEGVVTLHLRENEVTTDAVSAATCNGTTVAELKSLPEGANRLAIAGDNYVTCQEYGKIVPEEPVTSDLVDKLMPSYSIKKILDSGVVSGNTCGKFRTEAKPGELILFVRPRSLWERMRQ